MGSRPILCTLLLGTLVILGGCGGGGQNASSSENPALTTPTLTSISVSPSNEQVSTGSKQQFTAAGKYSDGSVKDLTISVNWTSSAAAVADISSSGLASARQAGTTTITASSGSTHGVATLSVAAAPLVSISITPTNASLAVGTALQVKAQGIFQDGSTQDLTGSVVWTSSNPSIVGISRNGVLQGDKVGTAQVFASTGRITGTANIAVTAATLVSMTITPAKASIAKQTTEQFSAIGSYSDGTIQNITALASWTSSQPSTATVAAGLASGLQPGNTTITAACGSFSASVTLTVTDATVVSITISPANPTLIVGLYQQFVATGSFTDGSTQDISGVVTWTSSEPTIGSINNAGLVPGINPGSTTISATFEGVTNSSIVTVQAPSLSSISVLPSSPSIANTTKQSFSVMAYYNDGSTKVLTDPTWSSSNPLVASMSGNVASSQQPGTTTITAVVGSFTASTTLNVTSAKVVSIAVTPNNISMAPGTNKAFFAAGTFDDGTTQNISNVATWTSSNTSVATTNGNYATGISGGTTTISASFESITGSTSLTVTQATLTSLVITPADPVLVIGATQPLAATGTFSDGSMQLLTSLVTWNSSQPSVSNVTPFGYATGQGAGTTIITATFGSITASTTLTVSAAPLLSLSISPATAAIPPLISRQFSATGTYSDGTVQNVTTMGHWTSSDGATATVGNSSIGGKVTGVSTGWTRISVVLGSIIASAVVNVNNSNLVSIAIDPPDPTLSLGTNQQLTAIATFSDGSTQDITPWVIWNSSNTQVCVVNSSGYALTSGSGTATISANFGSISATTTVTVY